MQRLFRKLLDITFENIRKKLFLLILLSLFSSILIFSSNINKVYIGVKYSFRTFRTNGDIIFVDPFGKKIISFNLYSRQVSNFLSNVGTFVIGVYKLEKGYILVDRVDPSIVIISDFGERISRVNLSKRVQGSLFNGKQLYVLLEGGILEVFELNAENQLKKSLTHNFEGSPSYIFLWKDNIFVTYLWNNERDIQFLGGQPKELGLTTPSLLIGDMLVDTRGGKLYNLTTNNIITISPYISNGYYDQVENVYYVASMSNYSVYQIKDDKVIHSFKVPFTPTNISKIDDYMIILSAPYNKVMITKNGKDIITFDTGDYPLEVFSLKDETKTGFAVYCSDSGEIYYYYF
ncbi:MAG: hypothetical protein ACK4R7_03790 [Fervidobacterium sp.]